MVHGPADLHKPRAVLFHFFVDLNGAFWYPAALDMFGRSESSNGPKFIQWGLKSVGNAEIRALYKQYVDGKLRTPGLDIPDERKNRRFLWPGLFVNASRVHE